MRVSRRKALARLGVGVVAGAATASSVTTILAEVEGGHGPIRLDRNENAYGPSPKVVATIERTARLVNRYPEAEAKLLRREIARTHGIQPDRIVLGSGAGEILRAALHGLAGPGGTVVAAAPGYDVFQSMVIRGGCNLRSVRLNADHSHDLAAMLAASDSTTRLVYLCNPNNPTGTLTRRRDIEAFLAKLPSDIFVIIDEAYHEYVGPTSDYASFLEHPVDDRRVIVVRSFSTIYGLAGLRVGYAIADSPTASLLTSSGLEADLTALSARAAIEAMHDPEHVRMSAARNADDRQEFFNQANARMLRAIDSVTNFVLLDTGGAARDVIDGLARHDILVAGPFGAGNRHIRVSIGTRAEMDEFWRAADRIPIRMAM